VCWGRRGGVRLGPMRRLVPFFLSTEKITFSLTLGAELETETRYFLCASVILRPRLLVPWLVCRPSRLGGRVSDDV